MVRQTKLLVSNAHPQRAQKLGLESQIEAKAPPTEEEGHIQGDIDGQHLQCGAGNAGGILKGSVPHIPHDTDTDHT